MKNVTKVVIPSSPGPFDALTALSEVEGLTGGSSVFKDFLDSPLEFIPDQPALARHDLLSDIDPFSKTLIMQPLIYNTRSGPGIRDQNDGKRVFSNVLLAKLLKMR
jgi:hypothetical protein